MSKPRRQPVNDKPRPPSAKAKQSRPRLAELAQEMVPRATMEGLTLPEEEKQLLREIVMHVAHRQEFYEHPGLAAKRSGGLGATTLFFGGSGTVKVMAAEALANELKGVSSASILQRW